ncbi:MAG: tetratricopeptide repeat protein [Promethearchaeota archaeon]
MSDSRPEQLIRAEELMYSGRVEEAFEMILNFEKTGGISPKDQLSALLLKGVIYGLKNQFKEGVEVGERAYSMSQKLGLVPESIEALNLKALIVHLGKLEEAFSLVLEAEKLLNSLSDEPPANITKLKLFLTYLKSWIYFFKNNFNIALDFAFEGVTLGEKLNYEVVVGYNLALIALIYPIKGEYDTALEYALKGLKIFERLDFQEGKALVLYSMGNIYLNMGDLNRSLDFFQRSLSIENLMDNTKVNILHFLGRIYMNKGELDKALQYSKQSAKLAEKISHYYLLVLIRRNIGEIYRRKAEIDKAIEYYKQSLALSEKMGNIIFMTHSILSLLLVSIDNNSNEQAEKYLKRLENLSDKHKSTRVKHAYPLGKAIILKTSNRMGDHTDAARLLKQIVEDDILYPLFHLLAIVSLCDLLLEELSIYSNFEIVNEINPLTIKLFKIAERQHSFSWIAEGKLLQAKLALIQMNIEEAKKLFTEAQNTAESYGLSLLSQKISKEHDNLLDQLDEWQSLKRTKAPISDRLKLASIDKVIDRLQGKRGLEPPELTNEAPILLLIISEGGFTAFSKSFVEGRTFEENLISGFLTAFNAFSNELFSEGLDRAKFGEHMVIMKIVGSFSVCYFYKGQSYYALQKLTRFAEAIRENTEIWQALNKSVKTSEMLELDKPAALKSVINEIFS